MVQSIYIVSIIVHVCKMAIAIFVETPGVSLHKSNPQSLLCKLGNVSLALSTLLGGLDPSLLHEHIWRVTGRHTYIF